MALPIETLITLDSINIHSLCSNSIKPIAIKSIFLSGRDVRLPDVKARILKYDVS